MLKSVIALGLLTASSLALALEEHVVQRNTICGTPAELDRSLSGRAGESVALRGTSGTTFAGEKADMFFFVNSETSTYTVVVATNKVACVLEDGKLYPNAVKPTRTSN